MFICSIKPDRRRVRGVFFVLVAVAAAITIVALCGAQSGGEKPDGSTPEARAAFLRSLGWELSEAGETADEIRIPDQFGDVYARYNDLQREQGMDLTPYRGQKALRCVYEITNHPRESGRVLATLLVAGGRIVGGDVCSPALDGFMHTLSFPAD